MSTTVIKLPRQKVEGLKPCHSPTKSMGCGTTFALFLINVNVLHVLIFSHIDGRTVITEVVKGSVADSVVRTLSTHPKSVFPIPDYFFHDIYLLGFFWFRRWLWFFLSQSDQVA